VKQTTVPLDISSLHPQRHAMKDTHTVASGPENIKFHGQQRFANGCFLANSLILLLVFRKKAATMGRLLHPRSIRSFTNEKGIRSDVRHRN
jgi:hypothetical protein